MASRSVLTFSLCHWMINPNEANLIHLHNIDKLGKLLVLHVDPPLDQICLIAFLSLHHWKIQYRLYGSGLRACRYWPQADFFFLIHLSNQLVLHVKKLLIPSLAHLDGLVSSNQS